MKWRSAAKAFNGMASSYQGTAKWRRRASRAGAWIDRTENATAILLDHYRAGRGEIHWAGYEDADRKAAHWAFTYIWRGEIGTPRDWRDEDVAYAAGCRADDHLVGIGRPSFSGDMDRMCRILMAFFSGLRQHDHQYCLYQILNDYLKKIREGHFEHTAPFIPVLKGMAEIDGEMASFLSASIKRFFSLGEDSGITDIDSFLRAADDSVEKAKASAAQDKADREKEDQGRRLCARGVHSWEFGGYEGVRYYGASATQTRITKIHMRCKYCGKMKPS